MACRAEARTMQVAKAGLPGERDSQVHSEPRRSETAEYATIHELRENEPTGGRIQFKARLENEGFASFMRNLIMRLD